MCQTLSKSLDNDLELQDHYLKIGINNWIYLGVTRLKAWLIGRYEFIINNKLEHFIKKERRSKNLTTNR